MTLPIKLDGASYVCVDLNDPISTTALLLSYAAHPLDPVKRLRSLSAILNRQYRRVAASTKEQQCYRLDARAFELNEDQADLEFSRATNRILRERSKVLPSVLSAIYAPRLSFHSGANKDFFLNQIAPVPIFDKYPPEDRYHAHPCQISEHGLKERWPTTRPIAHLIIALYLKILERFDIRPDYYDRYDFFDIDTGLDTYFSTDPHALREVIVGADYLRRELLRLPKLGLKSSDLIAFVPANALNQGNSNAGPSK